MVGRRLSGGEGGGSRAESFTLLLDTPLSSAVNLASWSPTMDLLAIATADRQLCVYRLNWQRLWAISPETAVTALCWRPDGRALAVGDEDGSITLLDVEEGEQRHVLKSHSAPVACMSWLEGANNGGNNAAYPEDRANRFFAPVPLPPTATKPGAKPELVGSDLNGMLDAAMTILCSADSTGVVNLTTYGLFPIASVDLRAVSVAEGDCLSLKLTPMQVASLSALHFDTGSLFTRRAEIAQVAIHACHVLALKDLAGAAMNDAQHAWAEAATAVSKQMQLLADHLADNGSALQAHEELQSFLVSGTVSPGLHQFLINLRDQGVRRLARSVHNAISNIAALLHHNFVPAVEVWLFRLGELRGILRWKSRAAAIGLTAASVERAIAAASALRIRCEAFIRLLGNVKKQYSAFLDWLLVGVRQFTDDRPAQDTLPTVSSCEVAEFINSQLQHDKLAPELEPGTAEHIRADQSADELDVIKVISSTSAGLDQLLALKLHQQFQQLCQRTEDLFSQLAHSLSSQCHLTKAVSLGQNEGDACVSYQSSQGDEVSKMTLLVASCWKSNGDGDQALQLTNFTRVGSDVSTSAAAIAMPPTAHVIDMAFYKKGQLALLMVGDGAAVVRLVECEQLPFVQLDFERTKPAAVSLNDIEHRLRTCGSDALAPLAVSGPRGVASILAGSRRIQLYDLEEDEAQEGDQENEAANDAEDMH
eukprot:jgi/Chlat1/2271/Chrsp17S02791